MNNEKLSIRDVIARLQNGSTVICDLDYTAATIVIGVDKANNYVLAQQGNQATAEITASTERVVNDDGSITETATTRVKNADGSITETIKKKVTNPDGTETTTENTKETVTDKDGKVLQTTEAITTTATGADGSQTITTSKTPETDANEIYSIAADGKVTKVDADGGDGVSGDVLGALSRGDGNIINTVIQSPSGSTNVLVRKSDASNVLVTKQVKTDAQGKITALSGSMTVMQTGGADGTGDTGPTQIAFDFGFDLGEYDLNVDIQGHGNVSVSPTKADKGEWVTIIAVPDNGYKLAKLYVTDAGDYNGETNGIRPTQSASDSNQYTFQIPSSNGFRPSTSFTIHAIFEAGGGGGTFSGGNGGGSVNAGGAHRAATTMTVNYETKKETDGGAATVDVSGGTRVTAGKNSVGKIMIGGAVDIIIGGGTRGATAEQEDDEIEIVSGKEYKILRDGFIVLNFYTPDADITVNSIVFRRPGDANNDGYVNAVDLVEMINAKNGHASERFNLTNADIDRDGTITQTDIDAVVKLIMEQTDEE